MHRSLAITITAALLVAALALPAATQSADDAVATGTRVADAHASTDDPAPVSTTLEGGAVLARGHDDPPPVVTTTTVTTGTATASSRGYSNAARTQACNSAKTSGTNAANCSSGTLTFDDCSCTGEYEGATDDNYVNNCSVDWTCTVTTSTQWGEQS